jgi:hypothetical protein
LRLIIGDFLKKSKRLLEHINAFKVIKPIESTLDTGAGVSFNFVDDDVVATAVMQMKGEEFSIAASGDPEMLGLLDAIANLYKLNTKVSGYRLNLRELDRYLSDHNTESFFNELDLLPEKLLESFQVAWDTLQKQLQVEFENLNTTEKIETIEKMIDNFYNVEFSTQGKTAHLVEIDGFEVVVSIEGSGSCDTGKSLEFLQNMLQDKLKCFDINVIEEF